MSKKILAIVLATVMMFAAIPMASFSAEDATATDAARVDAWEANYELLLNKVLVNEESTHWNYVVQNNESIAQEMMVYTAFALYDDAWQNAFDGSVSVTKAEEVLVSLIEKVDAQVGDSKLDEIIAVLQTAQDVNDFIQKVNEYVEISDVLTSDAWSSAFTYLGYAQTLAEIWQTEREVLIEAYARILSVQAANAYYLDFLQYVASNCTYSVVRDAASNLIADITTSIDELINDIMLQAAGNTGAEVVDVALRIAAESNAYTAVALKVYNTGTSVADALWNTSDQYAIMDQLITTFYAESVAADWAQAILDSRATEADAEKGVFAVNALLTLREIGAKSLYDLKAAQAQGVIGRIKDQINKSVHCEYVAEMKLYKIIRQQLFEASVSQYKKVNAIVVSFGPSELSACDASNNVLYRVPYGNEYISESSCGVFGESYNEYSRDYVKVALLYDNVAVAKLYGMTNSKVTLIMDVITDAGIEDYSFTDVAVSTGTEVFVPVIFTGFPLYTVTDANKTVVVGMNDDFVYPVENEATTQAVTQAVVNIAIEDTNESFAQLKNLIESFLKRLFEGLFKAFQSA